MSKSKTHFMSALLEDQVITACGRECAVRGETKKFVHEWKCASKETLVELLITVDGYKVDCGTCKRRLLDAKDNIGAA
jgi:hypothetical protein